LNQTLEVLGKLKQYAQFTWDFLLDGAMLGETRSAFQDYAQSVGRSGDEIVSKLKIASAGTIDEFNLIKTASLAMSLGVTKDADKMANLLEIAKNKARLFGVSTKQAFDDIVTGIGRASPKILDNLGIRIPAGFEKMTDGMSDADKVAKLFELTLDEGNKQLEAMGGVTYSGADSFRELEASWANLKRAGGELISNVLVPLNVALAKTLNLATAAIEAANDLYTLAAEKGIHGAGSPFRDITDAQLLEMYSGYRKDYANALSVGNSVASPANSFARSETGLDDASRLRAEQNLKAAEQNLLAVEKEMTRRSKMMLSYAEQTVDDVKIAFEDLYDSWLPGYAGKASKEWLREQDKLKRESDRLAKETIRNFEALADTASKDLDLFGDAFDDFIDDADKLVEEFGDDVKEIETGAERIAKILKDLELERYQNLAKLDPNDSQWGMLNLATGGLLNQTTYGNRLVKFQADEAFEFENGKKDLSKTIAEAVSTGFANADFSNFSLTLSNILTSVLSKSVSTKFPVLNAGGAVNWGNLGINLGVSAATQLLTRPGRFFGGREDHGKEAIQQSTDLKSNLSNAYLESFNSGLLPYLSDSAGEAMKLALADARQKVFGTSVGYTWEDSGNGIWSDLTRTYQLVDQGASGALEALNKAIKSADSYNREVERSIEVLVASGQDFAALQQQTLAYQKAADAAQYAAANPGLNWSDGASFSTDLADQIHDLVVTSEELVRQLGSATAERTSIINEGFSGYAPWLDTIPMKLAQESGFRVNIKIPDGWTGPLPGSSGSGAGWAPGVDVAGMTTPELYDAFSTLQTSFLDRSISPYTLDMVKQASTNRYELDALKLTDEDAYQQEYMAYLDKQLNIFEEVMRRQEEIFADEAKTYEERAAALEDFERTIDAYHQTKMQKLQREKQLEEEEKRMMAEQSMAKIEAGLSLVGELNQRGDKVLIIQGGDVQEAIDEMMIQFADNPEMIAILQKAKKTADAKALWG
jgi:hypothetical protein